MKDYNDIVNNKNALKDYPIKKFIHATSGMNLSPKSYTNEAKYKKELYTDILYTHKKKQFPIVHHDSLTTWGNLAAENWGLQINDILAMKTGQKMEVILMDRNSGESLSTLPNKKQFDPRKIGFTYGVYTHKEGLKGVMYMKDVELFECFEWEINGGCGGCFWGPIPKGKTYKDYDKKTKVGWRGPAIDMADSKNLPKKCTKYDTWWDDYVPHRYVDYLKVKRIKKIVKK
jgi:hypothetical protein